MSDKKEYSPVEVAQMLLERLKKNIENNPEVYGILEKAKNTAHEIEAGSEPNNDEAECPESLCATGASSEKSEMSEEHSMEDEPLQGDSDSDYDEDEYEEDEDEDEEDEEVDEDDYEFKKSEDGMFKVQYKRLKKGEPKYPSEKDLEYPDEAAAEAKKKRKEKLEIEHPESKRFPKFVRPRGAEKSEMNKCGMKKNDHKVKETEGIEFDKPKKADKNIEEEKGIARPLERRDGIKKVKKSEGMHTVEYARLEKAWLGGTQTSGQTGTMTQGTKGAGSGPSIAEQIGMKKADSKKKGNIQLRHSNEGGPAEDISDEGVAEINRTRPGGKTKKRSSKKDQGDFKRKVRAEKGAARKKHGETGEITAKYGSKESSNVAKDRREKDQGIEARQKYSGTEKRDEKRIREEDMENSEMGKCGEMKVAKSEKLANFIKKKKKMTELKKQAPDYSQHISREGTPTKPAKQMNWLQSQGFSPDQTAVNQKTGDVYGKPLGTRMAEGLKNFGSKAVKAIDDFGMRQSNQARKNKSYLAPDTTQPKQQAAAPKTQVTQGALDTANALLQGKNPAQTENMSREDYSKARTMEDPSKAMTKEDYSKAMSTGKPADTSSITQKPKAQEYGIKNPYSSDAIKNAKTFGQAFKQARKEIGAGGVFEYGGKKYNTYTQDEMKDMAAKGTGKGNKFFEDYDRRKDFTGSQDAPASERAYYANKQRPSARKQATVAPVTAQKQAAPVQRQTTPTARKETPYQRMNRDFESRFAAALPKEQNALLGSMSGSDLRNALKYMMGKQAAPTKKSEQILKNYLEKLKASKKEGV